MGSNSSLIQKVIDENKKQNIQLEKNYKELQGINKYILECLKLINSNKKSIEKNDNTLQIHDKNIKLIEKHYNYVHDDIKKLKDKHEKIGENQREVLETIKLLNKNI